MNKRTRLPQFSKAFYLAFSAAISAGSLQANPVGGNVIAGQADISGGAGTLTVNQASQKAIINWQDFSIGHGELTKFVQPNAASAVLNRVVGSNLSGIYGTLQSNGQVYLINPNGIVIGPTGVVNTGGFVASTQDIDNSQFLAGGDLTFKGNSTAKVVNLGKIGASTGDVILIAQEVENAGEISAPQGTAALAAGNEVLVKASGAERVFVQAGKGRVSNSGLIESATAELKAAGGNEYALAINNSGTIRATQVEKVGGRILLTAKNGNIRQVGTVKAIKTQTAEKLRDYEIADKGLVEICTLNGVELGGQFVTEGGVVFIDPSNVRISNDPNSNLIVVVSNPSTFTSSAPESNINVGEINNLLSGSNVIIFTTANFSAVNGLQTAITGNNVPGDISVEAAINWSSGYSLTLQAHNDIIVVADITATNGGNLNLKASGSGSGSIFLNSAVNVAGNLDVSANGNISQTAALVIGGATNINVGAGAITLNNANNDFIGQVSLSNTGSNAVLLRDKNDLDLGIISVGGDLTLRANGSILGNNAGIVSQGGKIILNADRDASGGGRIDLYLTSINSNGGKIVLGGGNDPETTAAIGTSAASDSEKTGIFLQNSSVQAGSGDILMRGQGLAGTTYGEGIFIGSGTTIGNTTTTGKITLVGIGGDGSSLNNGINVDASFITSRSGDISLTGTGGLGSAERNRGILIDNGSIIESTGTGSGAAKITLNGTARGGTYGNNGINIDNGAVVRSVRGNISVTGLGAGGTTNNHGVTLGAGGKILSTGTGANAATITIDGTSSTAGTASTGILVIGTSGSDTAIRSVNGAISITGRGFLGSGIYISGGGIVESTGSGVSSATITLNGLDRTLTGQGRGVWLANAGSGVASKDGDIFIIGQGAGDVATSYGIMMQNGAKVSSTGTSVITLTATGAGGSSDFYAVDAASQVGGSSATGQIVVNADSIDWGAGLLQFDTASMVTIQPRTAGTTIGVGGTNLLPAPGQLNLTSEELSSSSLSSRISQLIIGNNSSGALTAYSLNVPTRVQLNSGSDITVNGELSGTQDYEFNFGQAGAGTFTVTAGSQVIAALTSVATGGSRADTFSIAGYFNGNLEGKGGADTFNILDGANVIGTINGGNGNDKIDYQTITNSMTALVGQILNIETLIGNADWLTLEGATGNNVFEITGLNQGSIGTLQFSQVSTLQGRNGNDTFRFTTNASNLTGNISGSGGLDILDFSALTVRPVVQLFGADNAGRVTGRLGSFDNIDQITAGSAGGRVQGSALAETYAFRTGGVTAAGIKFVDFDQIRGGEGNDVFRFLSGTFTGTVEGNRGDDTFIFRGGRLNGDLKGGDGLDVVDLTRAGGVTVTLNGTDGQGSFRNTDFVGMDLFKGSGSDVLQGSAADDYFFFVTEGVSASNMGFENFGEVRGGRGDDQFDFYSGNFGGSVYGNQGSDLFYIYGGSLTGSLNGGAGDDAFLFLPFVTGDFGDYGTTTYTINTGSGVDGIVAIDFFASGGHSYILTANSFTRVGGVTINHDLGAGDAFLLKTGDFDDSVFTDFFAYSQGLDGSGHSVGDSLIIPGVSLTFPDGVLTRPGFGDIVYTGFERATPDPVVPNGPNQNLLTLLFADFQQGQANDLKKALERVTGFTGSGKASFTFASGGGTKKQGGALVHVSSGDVE